MLLSSLIMLLTSTTLEYFFFHFCLPQFYLCKGKCLTQGLRLILLSVIFHFKYMVIVSTAGILNRKNSRFTFVESAMFNTPTVRSKFLRGGRLPCFSITKLGSFKNLFVEITSLSELGQRHRLILLV